MIKETDDGPVQVSMPEHAHLALLCAQPRQAALDGEWIVILEDADHRPLEILRVGLAFDSQMPPLGLATDELHKQGYELHNEIVVKPYAASWRIVRE